MYFNKFKAFLVLTLVVIFTFSFAILANAEDASGTASDSSVVSSETSSTVTSDTSNASSAVTSDTSNADSAATSETSNANSATTSDNSDGGSASSDNNWLAWAVIGGIIVIIAIIIVVAVLTKSALGEKITKAFRDYKSEIKKVVWLSKKELLKQTSLVISILLISVIFLGLLDFLFTKLLALI